MESKRLITLYPCQVKHAKRLLYKLKYLKFGLDKSEMGSGKTCIAIWIIEELVSLGLCDNVIFILPKNLRKTWEKYYLKLKVQWIVMFYSDLSGPVKITDKTLVVADEVQTLSANNQKTTAMSSIADQIKKSGMLLSISATPFSDYNHAYSLFANLGIIDSERTSKPKLQTLKEFDYSKFLQNIDKRILILKKELSEKEYSELSFQEDFNMQNLPSYNGTIINRISAIHTAVTNIYGSECVRYLPEDLIIRATNSVYRLAEEDVSEASTHLINFHKAAGFTMSVHLKQLHKIELPYLADAGIKVLKKTPTSKVIFCVHENEHVAFMSRLLGYYGIACLTIYAGVDQLTRQTAQQLFNSYDTIYRSIIVTFGIANSGISLHDTAPVDKYPNGFPRTMVTFIDPDPLRRTQMLGRHIRTGITSKYVETIIVSTNIKVNGGMKERDILYSKSTADVELINSSVKSTDEASTFDTKFFKLNDKLNIYPIMKKILDEMEEFIPEEQC